MVGGIEEPFRLSFQIRGNLDLSHSVDLRMKLYVGRGGLLSHTTGILKRLRNTSSQVSSGSKANVLNQHKSTEEQPIARKVVASRASCTEKVSHRLYQSVNRKRNADCSFDLRCAMCRKRKKQRSNSYGEISISKQIPCPPSIVNLTTAQKKPSTEEQPIARKVVTSRASCAEKVIHRLYQSVNRCSTNERLNVADSPQVLEVTIHPSVELSDSSVPSVATSKTSKQTQSNRTVAPKREQEKRQVANYLRPRTSDFIRRNKDFKAEDNTKVLARRTGNYTTGKDVRSVDLSHSTRMGRLTVGVAS
ncbi:hypothetical protein CQW23_33498 [Capsicum baccatum]|uniref:Uncharacterized protein n=1 Tax=Capsicum baccatum TaxID=33114 RepID=A0A2G2V1V0_CAPBA|nr:hypothetical protein CQW23_33498 [Capsicum baccatum]